MYFDGLLNDKPLEHHTVVLRTLPLDKNGSSGTIVGIRSTKNSPIFAFRPSQLRQSFFWMSRFPWESSSRIRRIFRTWRPQEWRELGQSGLTILHWASERWHGLVKRPPPKSTGLLVNGARPASHRSRVTESSPFNTPVQTHTRELVMKSVSAFIPVLKRSFGENHQRQYRVEYDGEV